MSATSVRIDELGRRVGQEIAVSPWVEVTQDRIQAFADATGDHQWIHVDGERARASPYGATIAHGFLTLSLLVKLAEAAFHLSDKAMGINYGLNRVRFPAPVPSGSRVRGRFALASFEKLDQPGGVQVVWNATVEREGGEKPCLVAEWVVRYFA